ncbi:MAG: CotH kinase family protein [Deltaproteobacteria bacterium]|nr:CotH kinase family protein [Deltaproteobacteria bacterium]
MTRTLPGLLAGLLAFACGGDGPMPADASLDAALDAAADALAAADAAIDGAALGDCGPTGGGPHWIEEGEPLSVRVRCATGLELAGDAFVIANLPDGAAYDPSRATLDWTPGLDQGGVYDLSIEVPSVAEAGPSRIGVLDRWDDPENVPVVDPTTYTEEHGLPVFHVETSPELNHDDYTPATVTYRGHVYQAEAKWRGGASFGYPKRSYTLKFSEDDPFDDPDRAFLRRRKVTLTTTFDDNSYVRQRLAFEMWNLFDPGHLQVESFSAVVFVNGEYRGLYAATDHVDRFLGEAQGLSADCNLYKAVNHDGNFRLTSSQNGGAPKVTLHDGYEKKEGLPPEGEPRAFADLEALVEFVATASSFDFQAEIGDRIDQRDYEDWWIFVSFIEADDSAGKNSYHYHDPAGGPFRVVPWDFNASFGQDWQSERQGWDERPEELAWANELFARFLDEPTIGDPLRERYARVLDGPFALGEVTDLFDGMAAEVRDAALRDEERWAGEMRAYPGWSWREDFTTHEEEVEYVRDWLTGRWTFVQGIY